MQSILPNKRLPGCGIWAAFLSFFVLAAATLSACGLVDRVTRTEVSTPPAVIVTPTGWQPGASENLPGTPEATPTLYPTEPFVLAPTHTPEPTPLNLPTPNPWDGTTRVTILVLGLDYADWESADRVGPPRSDTMMLLTIDPVTKTAGMLSIPRDLWVTMPGIIGYHKINTAHRFGELYEMDGGGPGLAMRTVERLLNVDIQYYARIDFYAFERFIDELGGVEVDVPEEIKVDPIGPDNTVTLQPGRQLLDGPVSLAYARNRYTEGGDFDRAQRQQQVIMAIRDRILRLDMLPLLVYKSPALYKELSAGIQTNFSLEEVIQLSWLAAQIPQENIESLVIGSNEVRNETAPDGQAVFVPVPDRIRGVRDTIFPEAAGSPVWGEGDPLTLMRAENARVLVLNASEDGDAGEDVANLLREQGIYVVDVQQSDELEEQTQIAHYANTTHTLNYIVSLLGIQADQISYEYRADRSYDILVTVGASW